MTSTSTLSSGVLAQLTHVSFLNSSTELTAIQAQIDSGITNFLAESAQLHTFASVVAGGGAARLFRTGVLALGANATGRAAILLQGAASVGSIGAEAIAFEVAGRALNPAFHPHRWEWMGEGGLKQGFASSAINFTAFRGAGRAAQGRNIVFQHAAQSTAMVSGHNIAGALHVIPAPMEDLSIQFFNAERTNLQIGAGMAALHVVAPAFHAFERSLDINNQSRAAAFQRSRLEMPAQDFALAPAGRTGNRSKDEFTESRSLDNLLSGPLLSKALTPEALQTRLKEFGERPLSTPWEGGPPYDLTPLSEINVERTLEMAQGGQKVVVNRRVLDNAQLRKAEVLFASVPEEDFNQRTIVDGVSYEELMGDVMGSMTGKANPPGRRLHSFTPNYAAEFLRADLNRGSERIRFVSPRTTHEFQEAFRESVPDVLLLSGLNVNIPTLLEMGVFARKRGVKEVWLGGDAALGPYRILDEVFDRVIWGPAEQYLHRQFVGDVFPGHSHPPAERMLADVRWLFTGRDGTVAEKNFQTLHLALRLGCSQSCDYCAEGIKSDRGQARPPLSFEGAREIIDDAFDRGIRRVYFVDPDFGRSWTKKNDLEGRVVEYLHRKGMRWSTLTNVITMRRHGQEMIDHGLASIYLGIESLAPSHQGSGVKGRNVLKILDRAWQDQDETVRLIQNASGQGVLVFGLYILFNPGETVRDVEQGLQTLKGLVPLSQISTNQPFPGTDEFARAVREGLLFNLHPHSVRYGQMVWAPNGQKGPLHDPELVSRVYIQAHQTINDLARPGGFFDQQRKKETPPVISSP